MFQYEYEKRPQSSSSHNSRASSSSHWSRGHQGSPGLHYARRPLPPRPNEVRIPVIPAKTTVPLKVWIIASASCFAVCAVLVLATVVVTKWGSVSYSSSEIYSERPEPIHAQKNYFESKTESQTTVETVPETTTSSEDDNIILERLSRFKNIVASREKNKKTETKKPEATLISKTQIHPIHDTSIHHPERKIEKKDQARFPGDMTATNEVIDVYKKNIPEFRPTLPDVFVNRHIVKLPDGYVAGLRKVEDDYSAEYYNDDNLYEDYMQSNTMTSYLIEKVQELHDWITSDPDFEAITNSTNRYKKNSNDFSQLLKALNDSLVEGNVTIVMNKLRDIYFADNFTNVNHTRKVIVTNSTDLLSFGILTLDVMLLHNIQMMAWENQEAAKVKMLKDKDVFAFNALFLEPKQVEAKQNEVHHDKFAMSRRTNRIESVDDFDFGKNLVENVLEIGMSTARAAIHLGRAYKNTKMILNQISHRDNQNLNLLSRKLDGNAHALNHLQTSFSKDDSSHGAVNATVGFYTDLDCIWLLYCRNLAATAKLNAPYGTMARINGPDFAIFHSMALRMLSGELSADKALDTMLYEALSGWTDLKCNDMFPRCSKVDAASVVMESITQPMKKSVNRAR